jgi:hypothetical protein
MPRYLLTLPFVLLSLGSFAQTAGRRPAAREPVDQLFLDAAVARLQHAKAYTLAVAE